MPTLHLDVRMVSQRGSPDCWLACAAMIIQFKRGYTPTTRALGMAGEDFRTPNYSVPAESPSNKITYQWLRNLGFTLTRSNLVQRQIPRQAPVAAPSRHGPAREEVMSRAERMIHWLLANKGPFILFHHVGSFWYGPQWGRPTPGGAHAVVITGIETTAPRSRVYFHNPWGDRDVATTTTSIESAWRRWEARATPSIAYLD